MEEAQKEAPQAQVQYREEEDSAMNIDGDCGQEDSIVSPAAKKQKLEDVKEKKVEDDSAMCIDGDCG